MLISIAKWVLGFVVLLAILAGLVSTWPVTASRFIYPIVERYAIDDFVGVTANGQVQGDLFSIRKTGVSTAEVVEGQNTEEPATTVTQPSSKSETSNSELNRH